MRRKRFRRNRKRSLISRDKTKYYYYKHFDKDSTDFDHIYEILINIEKDVLSYNQKELRKYGRYFAKAPVKEIRMEWAEHELIELTPEQAEFICTMGVVIIARAIMILNTKPFKKDEE